MGGECGEPLLAGSLSLEKEVETLRLGVGGRGCLLMGLSTGRFPGLLIPTQHALGHTEHLFLFSRLTSLHSYWGLHYDILGYHISDSYQTVVITLCSEYSKSSTSDSEPCAGTHSHTYPQHAQKAHGGCWDSPAGTPRGRLPGFPASRPEEQAPQEEMAPGVLF